MTAPPPTARGDATPLTAEIRFREFDEERINRELEESLPTLQAQLKALEEAKRVSSRVLNLVITI